MHPLSSTTLLLLSSSLPLAFGYGGLFGTRTNPPGCHSKFMRPSHYIYFTSPSDSSFLFSIYTEWDRWYPSMLRAGLLDAGFKLEPQPSGVQTGDCNWTNAASVKVAGWVRGDINFKDVSGPRTAPQVHAPPQSPASQQLSQTGSSTAHPAATASAVPHTYPGVHLPRDAAFQPSLQLPAVDQKPMVPRSAFPRPTLHGSSISPSVHPSPNAKDDILPPILPPPVLPPPTLPDLNIPPPVYAPPMLPIFSNMAPRAYPPPTTPMTAQATSSIPPVARRATGPQSPHRPQQETLDQIRRILLATSPEADIAFFILQVIVPIAATVLILFLALYVGRAIGRRYYSTPRSGRGEEEDGAVELANLKLEGRSRQRGVPMDPFVDPQEKAQFVRVLHRGDERLFAPAQAKAHLPTSSSVYSRSVDGVTLHEGW